MADLKDRARAVINSADNATGGRVMTLTKIDTHNVPLIKNRVAVERDDCLVRRRRRRAGVLAR
jgi:hypothetical protein